MSDTRFHDKTVMIFDDQLCFRTGERYGADEAHILFLLSLARTFGTAEMWFRVKNRDLPGTYPIDAKQVAIRPLPYYRDFIRYFLGLPYYLPATARQLGRSLRTWDVLLLAWPHPTTLLILALMSLAGRRRPWYLMARQNQDRLIRLRYTGVVRLFAVTVNRLIEAGLGPWSSQGAVFAVGKEMSDDYSRRIRRVHQVTFPVISVAQITDAHYRPPRGDDVRLLYVGRLEAEKGVEFLVRSLPVLQSAGISVRVDIIGPGPLKDSLVRLVAELDVSEQVLLHGGVPFGPKLFGFYRQAHFLIVPSLSEGVPKVLPEAMNFGVPVIATGVGGIVHYLTHGETGWLIAPGSPDAIAEAVRHLVEHPETAVRISTAARDRARAFTMEAQQEKLLMIIDSEWAARTGRGRNIDKGAFL